MLTAGLRQIRCSYTNWTYGSAQQCDDFFSDRATIQLYKNHVRKVLTRVNTLTGLAYGADPTIFGAAPGFKGFRVWSHFHVCDAFTERVARSVW